MTSEGKGGVIRGKMEECKVEKRCISDPKFVGLDLSYTGTGIIVIDSNGEILEQKLINTDSKYDTEDRIIQIENEINFIPNIIGLGGVYIEGPAFSAKGSHMLQMGALNFYVRIFLRKKDVDYKIIPPTTLKKWTAGTGRAKKELMLLHVYKRWGIEFSDNNLCDAFSLARMALEKEKI